MPWRGGWNYYEDWTNCHDACLEDGTLEYGLAQEHGEKERCSLSGGAMI